MKKSKNLHIIKNKNNYYVYHKLYGNLTLMDENVFNFLNEFDDKKDYTFEEKKLIQELSDLYFLNNNTEEYQPVLEEKANRNLAIDGRLLIGLQLIMSNFCNFNCKYCFLNEEHKLRDNSSANVPSNMTYETASAAINFMLNNLKKNDNSILCIEFFGGEPLMNWPVIKNILDNYGNKKNSIQIEYTITTNGSLLSNEILDYFEKYNVSLIISYDSPKNNERTLKNNKNLNEILFPIFKKIKSRNFPKSFNSVISKYTLNNYDPKGLIDLAKNFNIDNIGLILDLDAEFLKEGYTLTNIVELILDSYDYGNKLGINITGYWKQMFMQINNQEDIYLNKGYKACPALGCKISVEPSGDIFACKCCPTKIGEIQNSNKFLNDKEYKNYLNRIYKNSDICKDCELSNFCSGVCVGSLEKSGSMYGTDKNLCYLYREITKKLILKTSKQNVSTCLTNYNFSKGREK